MTGAPDDDVLLDLPEIGFGLVTRSVLISFRGKNAGLMPFLRSSNASAIASG